MIELPSVSWDRRVAQHQVAVAASMRDTALIGLHEMLLQPNSNWWIHGLRIVTTFGRASVEALRELSGVVGADVWNEWFDPRFETLKSDPLLKFMSGLRNKILHQGTIPGLAGRYEWSGVIRPGAVLPPDALGSNATSAQAWIENGPTEHRGQPISDSSLQTYADLYLLHLGGLLGDAGDHFGYPLIPEGVTVWPYS